MIKVWCRFLLGCGGMVMGMASVQGQDKVPTTAEAKDEGPAKAAPNPKEMVEQAIKAIEQTEYDNARKLLEKVDALAPTLPELSLAKGMMLVRADRGREALMMLDQYNRTKPGERDHRGFWEAGKLYRQSHATRQAEEALQEAYELAPPVSQNDPAGVPIRARIGIDLAEINLDLDKSEDALRLAGEALDMAPRNPGLQFLFGSVSWRAKPGAWKDALRATKEAARLFNEQLTSNPFNLDRLTMLRGCYSQEINIYTSVSKQNPGDPEVLFNLAQAIREAASVDLKIALLQAREFGLKALKADPNNADRALFVADIEINMGASNEPLARIDSVLKQTPDHPLAKMLRERVLALKAYHEQSPPSDGAKPSAN